MAEYNRLLGVSDAWWLMFFDSVSFGGFVGLTSFLPIYFHGQYDLSPVNAGYFTAACVYAGSFARPFGGALADRIGGTRVLMVIYAVVAVILFAIAQGSSPAAGALIVLLVGMIALGMGNGAVFQLVPQRFARDVGLITGLVGMTGGSAVSRLPRASATPSNSPEATDRALRSSLFSRWRRGPGPPPCASAGVRAPRCSPAHAPDLKEQQEHD